MRNLILFSIDKNHFAIELDKIKRIIQAQETTSVPGNADEIEGITTFEDSVINVLNFRKIIGMEEFTKTLDGLFPVLIQGHEDWVKSLSESVDTGCEFHGEISPYDCALGKWLNEFNSYDPAISKIKEALFTVHSEFHGQAPKVIHTALNDKEEAKRLINTEVSNRKDVIVKHIHDLHENKELIANSMQKFLIMDAEKMFAVRIDDIDDIIYIEDDQIQMSDISEEASLISIDGIFEHNDKLVNLISTISMPESNKEQ